MPRTSRPATFVLVVAAACTSAAPETAEERLLERRRNDAWVEADARTPEGRRTISDELARARGGFAVATGGAESAPAPIPQEAPRAASRPIEPPPSWPGPKLAVVFHDAPLKDVVAAVAAEMGVNAVVPDDLDRRVTVSFPSIDPLHGLDVLLRQHGRRVRFENGVLTAEVPERPKFTKTFVVRTHRPFDVEKLVRPLLGEGGIVVHDELRKQFTVTDEQDALDRVAAFLRVADSRAPQVVIEALIVEVRRGRDSAHGANVEFGDVGIGDATGVARSLLAAPGLSGGPAPFTFGVTRADDMLQVLLSARAGRSKFNVLSNPLVAAISGTKAEIKVVERIPYVQSTNTINVDGGNAATNSTQQIEFEEVGVTLTVTPTVGADRVVEMEVTPDVRELVDFVLGTPVIDTRKVQSNVLVRNNETLVIGGLLRSARRRREDKVPVLGDVPLLGDLFFKRELDEQERVELLIFVTPHVVGFGDDAVEGYRPQDDLLGPGGRAPRVDRELRAHPGTPSGAPR
ncbi:MAG TPA: hypothetical protein VEI02_15230 [Planctomycetota bacterium]|nr:hypothetical protein [Planctomycetota bacterium]